MTRHPTPDEVALLVAPSRGFSAGWTGVVSATAVFITFFLVVLMLTAFLEGPPPWAVPSAVIVGLTAAVWWYFVVKKQHLRAAVEREKERAKAAESDVVATTYAIQDAIAIEEFEDEGLSFYLLLDDSRTLFLTGQYLYQPVEDGFPWRSFEIVRVSDRGWVLAVKPLGDPFTPTHTRPHFTIAELKDLPADGTVDALDWESLKAAAA